MGKFPKLCHLTCSQDPRYIFMCINETKVKILFIRLAETTNWRLVSQVYPANMFCLAITKIRFGNVSMA